MPRNKYRRYNQRLRLLLIRKSKISYVKDYRKPKKAQYEPCVIEFNSQKEGSGVVK